MVQNLVRIIGLNIEYVTAFIGTVLRIKRIIEVYNFGLSKCKMDYHASIGAGWFRILGGGGQCLEYWGSQGGGKIPSRQVTSK